jgi:hypothetical protein
MKVAKLRRAMGAYLSLRTYPTPRMVPVSGCCPAPSTFPRSRYIWTSTTFVSGTIRIPQTLSRIIERVTTRHAFLHRCSSRTNSCWVSCRTCPPREASLRRRSSSRSCTCSRVASPWPAPAPEHDRLLIVAPRESAPVHAFPVRAIAVSD